MQKSTVHNKLLAALFLAAASLSFVACADRTKASGPSHHVAIEDLDSPIIPDVAWTSYASFSFPDGITDFGLTEETNLQITFPNSFSVSSSSGSVTGTYAADTAVTTSEGGCIFTPTSSTIEGMPVDVPKAISPCKFSWGSTGAPVNKDWDVSVSITIGSSQSMTGSAPVQLRHPSIELGEDYADLELYRDTDQELEYSYVGSVLVEEVAGEPPITGAN